MLPFIRTTDAQHIDAAETTIGIQAWIRDKVHETQTEGVVLGMSGGIDSSLVAALCVNALGSEEAVLGMILNCENQPHDAEDAVEVARKFGIATETIDLLPTFNAMSYAIGGGLCDHRLARANLKSRLRMCALYARANECSALVVGTTNLTEYVLGYYTKYGDGGVDIEPIQGLLKREVRALARRVGVPGHIIHKAPSAGLWDGQTDEEELGATYDELDDAVLALIAHRCPPAETSDRQYQVYHKVSNIFTQTEHKREPVPTVGSCVVFRRRESESPDRS